MYLSDITITTSHSDQEGVVKFASTVSSSHSVNVSMNYGLVDKAGNVVASVAGPDLFEGTLVVKNPMLWWPVGMSDQPAYLYSLKVWLMNIPYLNLNLSMPEGALKAIALPSHPALFCAPLWPHSSFSTLPYFYFSQQSFSTSSLVSLMNIQYMVIILEHTALDWCRFFKTSHTMC